MTHTPGPWTWAEHQQGLNGANDEPVLAFAAYEGMWLSCLEDRDEANARLIAAAPDLLDALKAMCAEFRGYDLPYGSAAYQQATAAINKAEGQREVTEEKR